MEKFKLPQKLVGARIELVKRSHNDDEQMWQSIEESRTVIREYLPWVDRTTSMADVVEATDMFAGAWETDKEWVFDIYRPEDNRLLGCIGVHNINFACQSAELGYWLRNSETHKGYMREAVQIVEPELFKAGMHRITICCDVQNKASANVAINSGYKLESIAKEALYHPKGLHDKATYVKFSPYPIKGFEA